MKDTKIIIAIINSEGKKVDIEIDAQKYRDAKDIGINLAAIAIENLFELINKQGYE